MCSNSLHWSYKEARCWGQVPTPSWRHLQTPRFSYSKYRSPPYAERLMCPSSRKRARNVEFSVTIPKIIPIQYCALPHLPSRQKLVWPTRVNWSSESFGRWLLVPFSSSMLLWLVVRNWCHSGKYLPFYVSVLHDAWLIAQSHRVNWPTPGNHICTDLRTLIYALNNLPIIFYQVNYSFGWQVNWSNQ